MKDPLYSLKNIEGVIMSNQTMSEQQIKESSQTASVKKPKARFSKLKLHLIATLIFAVIIIAGFIWLQRSTGFFSNLLNSAPANQIKLLQQQIAQQSEQINNNQVSIAQLTNAQNKQEVSGALMMAEHLILFANFSLLIEHNIPTAIQLLTQAQSYLDRADGDVSVLKTAISANVSQLQSISIINTSEIYAKLQALSQQVSQLSLIDEGTQISIATNQEAAASGSFWHRSWHETLAQLKSLVIIRHRDESVQPLLTINQQQWLILNLRLLLTQAQSALLNHHQQIFDASLQEIQSLVKEYFLRTNTVTANFLKSLDAISKINIAPALPDLNKSLVIAQALNQSAHSKDAKQ